MAVPKRKTSKSKRDMRRTHDKISGPQSMECPQCGEAVLRHHVCTECGHYKGREVIPEEED